MVSCPRTLRRFRVDGSALGFLVLLGLATGCSAGPTFAPVPTWPVPAEVLPQATSGGAAALITCGGRSFPASGLTAPTGAEKAQGPEFDALRATLQKFKPEFPGSDAWAWRLAGRDATGATFMARTTALGSDWAEADVTVDASGWHPSGMGGCEPRTVLSADFGPARWALDPAFAAPAPDTTELHILVWEGTCSGGAPATDDVRSGSSSRSFDDRDDHDRCASTPGCRGSRVRVPDAARDAGDPTLPSAAPERGTLLDGGTVPPAPPSPANG